MALRHSICWLTGVMIPMNSFDMRWQTGFNLSSPQKRTGLNRELTILICTNCDILSKMHSCISNVGAVLPRDTPKPRPLLSLQFISVVSCCGAQFWHDSCQHYLINVLLNVLQGVLMCAWGVFREDTLLIIPFAEGMAMCGGERACGGLCWGSMAMRFLSVLRSGCWIRGLRGSEES